MKTIEEQILSALEGQRFADWYDDKLNDFICGDGGQISRQEILDDIGRIFGLSRPLVRFE